MDSQYRELQIHIGISPGTIISLPQQSSPAVQGSWGWVRLPSHSHSKADQICLGSLCSWTGEIKGDQKTPQMYEVPPTVKCNAGQGVNAKLGHSRYGLQAGQWQQSQLWTAPWRHRGVQLENDSRWLHRYRRSMPKIKWNKSEPAYAKQHVHIYKWGYSHICTSHLVFDTKLTISLVKNDLLMLLYYEAYYKIWNQ